MLSENELNELKLIEYGINESSLKLETSYLNKTQIESFGLYVLYLALN